MTRTNRHWGTRTRGRERASRSSTFAHLTSAHEADVRCSGALHPRRPQTGACDTYMFFDMNMNSDRPYMDRRFERNEPVCASVPGASEQGLAT